MADGNGAAIRYEGGRLTLNNDYFHNNQEGLLAASDPNGVITINHSEFAFNGDGSGFTHNLYVNNLAQLIITNSYFHDAAEGHEIKSRAQNTTITNDRIFDNNGTASYSIDLPNGGNATIQNNIIEQGPNSDNPFIIAYGEEGKSNPGTGVSIADNTIVNDLASNNAAVVLNRTSLALPFDSNQIWGLSAHQLSSGPLDESGTVLLSDHPSLDTSSLSFITGGGSSSPPPSSGSGGSGVGTPTPPPAVTVGSGADTLDLQVNEDAWKGDAQFTVAVDGQQIGGTLTAQASHAAGDVQDFLIKGDFGPGQHTATVAFLNDAYGGSPATDRNLYVTGASYDGQSVSGSSLNYFGMVPRASPSSGSTVAAISSRLSAPLATMADNSAVLRASRSGLVMVSTSPSRRKARHSASFVRLATLLTCSPKMRSTPVAVRSRDRRKIAPEEPRRKRAGSYLMIAALAGGGGRIDMTARPLSGCTFRVRNVTLRDRNAPVKSRADLSHLLA